MLDGADRSIEEDLHERIKELEKKNEKLRMACQSLIGWAIGGTCSDCTPFAEGCGLYTHHKGCACLESINKARDLIGMTREIGYDFGETKEAHEAERKRLKEERAKKALEKKE